MKDVIGTLVRDLSRRAGCRPSVSGRRPRSRPPFWWRSLAFALLRPVMPNDALIPFMATLFFLMACVALHFALREDVQWPVRPA